MDFKFYAPTKVIFGQDSEIELINLLNEFNAHRVLIHYGGNSAIKSGLIAKVERMLIDANIPYYKLGGVKPNPRLSLVEEGIKMVKENNIDFLLAIGGGSVIDSSKAIGYGVCNEGDLWDYYLKKKTVKACLPLGCILTIAAAGSEMSDSSVITNEALGQKRGLSSDLGRCRFAILNPVNTYTVSTYQTMCGVVDMIMHTFERYFVKDNHNDIQKSFALSLIKQVIKNAYIVLDNPCDYDARANLMLAGTMAHNDVCGARSLGDWASHQLEHELSAKYDVAHGAGLSAIWASWARYVIDEELDNFILLANEVFNIYDDNKRTCALAGIEAMESFFKDIKMPINLKQLDLDLTDEDLYDLAYNCSYQDMRIIGKFKELNIEDMYQIYKAAKG